MILTTFTQLFGLLNRNLGKTAFNEPLFWTYILKQILEFGLQCLILNFVKHMTGDTTIYSTSMSNGTILVVGRQISNSNRFAN